MEFVIRIFFHCEAHHGKANGNSMLLTNVTNITNTLVHHVVATKGVKIEKEQMFYVELQKNQQLWHCHNQISHVWAFFVLNNLATNLFKTISLKA
jgi:hypothetical protein